jgi:GDP-D-mannose 3',5'-epimerase
MAKIVVLGHGFIGSNLVSFLKDKGHYVRTVNRSLPQDRQEAWLTADERRLYDLRDPEETFDAVEGMDYVVNLAANMGGVGFFHAHNYTPFIDNMRIDMNVLQACEKQGIKRLLYSSSACIYPIHLQQDVNTVPAFREDQIYPANSDQNYGWEKLMMLRLCQEAPFDARVCIFHTIFGEHQEIRGERMKFPTAIVTKAVKSKRTGQPIEIWGDGSQVRSYLYIQDALEKIYRVLMSEENHTPVNIGSSEAVSVLEVAKMVCDILEIPHNFVFNEAKPSGVLARNSDNTKFEEYYDYKNQFTTREGFKRLIEWVEKSAID